MFQLLLYLLKLLAILVFGAGTIVMLRSAIVHKRNQKDSKGYIVLTVVFSLITLFIWNYDLMASESSDREENEKVFESNFGFPPPESIEEIKVKNFFLYDNYIQWMRFTYDQATLSAILRHDQPLDTAFVGSDEYSKVMIDLRKSRTNAPGWWLLPSPEAKMIFYKKNFLNHSFSDYHLWADPKQNLVYLQVSYFD